MSKSTKKRTRAAFRDAVFARDHHCCKVCGEKGTGESLDAHHITSRDHMVAGGYVAENGITLCKKSGGCHEQAEAYKPSPSNSLGDQACAEVATTWSPEALYSLIGSTYEQALEASKKLKEE